MIQNEIKRRIIKITFLGDFYSGKSQIINAFNNLEYDERILCREGREKYESNFQLNNGEEIKIIFWDTYGQERFISISLLSCKNSQGLYLFLI